jgi:predicted transcriptional regulator
MGAVRCDLDNAFVEMANMTKALNPFRLQLLRYVNEHRNTTVNGVCEGIGRKQSVVSVNLVKMGNLGILERNGDGTKGYYRVSKKFKDVINKLHEYLNTDFDYTSATKGDKENN